MSSGVRDFSKPLPPPARDELPLPPPPPPPHTDTSPLPPPPPPPKIMSESDGQGGFAGLQGGPASSTDFEPGASRGLDSTPPSTTKVKQKKASPLSDLMDSELVYVDLLSGIIRKVASAFSRQNLPPPQLDAMFRRIEAIYKTNRALLSKLKAVSSDSSNPNPKALGDLLMKWIGDLDGPYNAYCSQYIGGFDSWPPVESNERLQAELVSFSENNPPASGSLYWTMDALFLLPRDRIKYYQKLYGRLLKNANPGRGGDRLLTAAVETLERLMNSLNSRLQTSPDDAPQPSTESQISTQDDVVIDLRDRSGVARKASQDSQSTVKLPGEDASRGSIASGSSSQGSNFSTDRERFSQETLPTSTARSSIETLSSPAQDLERRIDCSRCLDLFTMNFRQVNLIINPPTLPFTRSVRFSSDVVIHFTPKCTGEEVVHKEGHIFLLTDLFLVCEKMSRGEREQNGLDRDMWLLYPPLAGKHLRVSPTEGSENSLEIIILKKEVMRLIVDSSAVRDVLVSEFRECSELARSLPPASKQPPPPLPSLGNIPSSSSVPSPGSTQGSPMPRSVSQGANLSPPQTYSTMPNSSSTLLPPFSPQRAVSPLDNLSMALGNSLQQGAATPHSERLQPQRQASEPPPPGYSQIDIGRVVPPPRSDSARPSQTTFPDAPQPGQFVPPPRGESMRSPAGIPGGLPPRPVQRNGALSSFTPGEIVPVPGNQILQPQPHHPTLPHSPRLPQSGQPFNPIPMRSPSEPSFQGGVRKSPSSRSLNSQYEYEQGYQRPHAAPPVPALPSGSGSTPPMPPLRQNSQGSLGPRLRPMLPSVAIEARISAAPNTFDEPSPPNSPVEDTAHPTGPIVSSISATMKCKLFLQQQHQQWKSLGSAKLTLYDQQPVNTKQLVIEADNKEKTMLVSTIVYSSGVERVGRTGVAIELGDNGTGTGIVYMIQLRNEKSAGGLFDSLLAGTSRATG